MLAAHCSSTTPGFPVSRGHRCQSGVVGTRVMGRASTQGTVTGDGRYTSLTGATRACKLFRVYEPFIRDSWHGVLAGINRPVTVSFKAPPRLVINGVYDAALRTWFRNAPNHRPTWWTYWHEPEDDIEHGVIQLTATAPLGVTSTRLPSTGTKALHPTLILMCSGLPTPVLGAWSSATTREASSTSWHGTSYNPPGWMRYASPKALMGPAVHSAHTRKSLCGCGVGKHPGAGRRRQSKGNLVG